MIFICPLATMRLKGTELCPKAESALSVEARVKKRMGHSGPRTLAKWRMSGISVRTGRVSTMTATFLSIWNESPDAADFEEGVAVTVGQAGARGASRLEIDRWSPLLSAVLHQYVVPVMMNTRKQERAASVYGRPFMIARFTYREWSEGKRKTESSERTRGREKLQVVAD